MISTIASPTSMKAISQTTSSSPRYGGPACTRRLGPPTRLFHYDFYYTFSVTTATICAILPIAFSNSSKQPNQRSQMLREERSMFEQDINPTHYQFHTERYQIRLKHACLFGDTSGVIDLHNTEGRREFWVSIGQKSTICSMISPYIAKTGGWSVHREPPSSGVFLQTKFPRNFMHGIRIGADIYAAWRGQSPIWIGQVSSFTLLEQSPVAKAA